MTINRFVYQQWKIPSDGSPVVEYWVVDIPGLDIYEKFGTRKEAMAFWNSRALSWRMI